MIASVSGSRMVNVVPWPRTRPDVDGPAQVLDPALDDVHADAAPGDLGDGLGGAEARVPDVGDQVAVGELAGLGLARRAPWRRSSGGFARSRCRGRRR